jgi:aryl-alcohol dehydrogenase-like predicted oxidoreductase
MELRRRPLGNAGLSVSELGLGAMDTPTSPEGLATLAAAMDLGIEFFDTARDYEGSEFLLAETIRRHGREGLVLGSKTFSRTADGSQWDVDRSLRVLGLASIPLYQLHDVRTNADWQQVTTEAGALEGLQTAQYRGLVGHIGLSTHNLDIASEAIDSGLFATIMLEYSAFYPESASLIERASAAGMGVIVMRPLGGSGRTSVIRRLVAEGTAGPLTPGNLLRYVLTNPGVSVAIPGARFPDRVRENVATALAYEPMSTREQREIERAAAALY